MPRTIGPKDTIRVEAVLAPSDWEGPFTQPFVLHFAGFRRGIRVNLSGRHFLPFPEVIDLGPFERNVVREIPMWEIAGKAGVRISRVACRDDRVTMIATGPDRLRITVGPLEVGSRVDTFADVIFEAGPSLPTKQRIWIRGMASSGLVVDPEDLVFGLVRVVGPAVTKKVRIRSNDGRPFELTEADFDEKLLSINVIREGPTETICHVTLHPQRPQAIDSWITLSTVDGTRGVKIRCMGTAD